MLMSISMSIWYKKLNYGKTHKHKIFCLCQKFTWLLSQYLDSYFLKYMMFSYRFLLCLPSSFLWSPPSYSASVFSRQHMAVKPCVTVVVFPLLLLNSLIPTHVAPCANITVLVKMAQGAMSVHQRHVGAPWGYQRKCNDLLRSCFQLHIWDKNH